MSEPKRYAIREDLAFRKLADQMVIVDPRGGVLHTLTEVGCFAWQQLEQGVDTSAALVAAITTEFEVDDEQAGQDLNQFLQQLQDKELVMVAEGEDR